MLDDELLLVAVNVDVPVGEEELVLVAVDVEAEVWELVAATAQ